MDKTLDGHLIERSEDDNFEFYRSFQFQEDAQPFLELLKENEIPYEFDGSETIITEAIVGSSNYPKFVLKILQSDFPILNSIIEQEVLKNSADFHEHYLYDFTDHELLAILRKPDQSSIEDITITKELLRRRGIPIDPSALVEMKQERLTVLQKGKAENDGWMLLYFLLLVAISIFFNIFFIIGTIGLSWHYWKDKSADIDGNKFYTYNEQTRKNGITFGILSIILTISLYVTFAYFLVDASIDLLK
ncbi:MAG: hypothetical protein AB8F94_04870 [Saprospiraceae bacterium]